mgnify:CR=1 FL=1
MAPGAYLVGALALAFIVETFSDLVELELAIAAIRSVTDLPIVAEVAFSDDAHTFAGRSPAEVATTLRGLAVDAIGAANTLNMWLERDVDCLMARTSLYDGAFTSCNRAFQLRPKEEPKRWCRDCPKCRFTFLMLAGRWTQEAAVAANRNRLLDQQFTVPHPDRGERGGCGRRCGIRRRGSAPCG